MTTKGWREAGGDEWRKHGLNQCEDCLWLLECCGYTLLLNAEDVEICPHCGKQFRLYGHSYGVVQVRGPDG